jgi:hypothetical protein
MVLTLGLASAQSDERSPDALAAFNNLAVGCNETGAVVYLLQRSRGSVTYGLGKRNYEDTGTSSEFDYMYLFTTPTPGEAYVLLCKEGFLIAKLRTMRDDPRKLSPLGLYREEVASGKQHPSRRPSIAQKIRWARQRQSKTPARRTTRRQKRAEYLSDVESHEWKRPIHRATTCLS